MANWQTLWTWIFGLSVFLFFFVEIVVVFGGARDIGDMLRSLTAHAEEERSKEGGEAEK
ncbi:MAG: hypothetical protein ACI906_003734 [Candidatus Latescibacterota bacterium]|jgi:hypothetical protein